MQKIIVHKYHSVFFKVGALLFVLVFIAVGVHLLVPSKASPVVTLPGDINDDGNVNIFDLSLMLKNYGVATHTCVNTSFNCDINGDGMVNIFDLSTLLRNWGKTVAQNSLMDNQIKTLQTIYTDLQPYWDASSGRYLPGDTSNLYGRDNWPSALAAVLSRAETDQTTASQEAQEAIAAENYLIDHHQNADGSPDTDFVTSTFTWEGIGLTANILEEGHKLDAATLHKFEQSMVKFAIYAQNSNGNFYINGNVNLHETLIDLEALKLAQADSLAGPNDAAYMQADYAANQAFIMNPCAARSCSQGANGNWGWNQVNSTTGYFSETVGNFPSNFACATNASGVPYQSPCLGLDYNYGSDHVNTEIDGYILSGYDSWWQRILTQEFNSILARIQNANYQQPGGYIDLTGGSRHTLNPGTPPPPFFTSAYEVLVNHSLATNASPAALSSLWTGEQADMQLWLGWTIGNGPAKYTSNWFDMELSTEPAIALWDLQQAN